MFRYTAAQREALSREAQGKRVRDLTWEPERPAIRGGYWIMTFEDGTEISFRFMTELRDGGGEG